MFDLTLNEEILTVNLDLVSEFRDKSRIREAACKIRASRGYNTKVRPRSFQKGDLLWRMHSDARKNKGKFSSNWEGPFRVQEIANGGAYHLEWLLGKIVPGRGIPHTSSSTTTKINKVTHSFLTPPGRF